LEDEGGKMCNTVAVSHTKNRSKRSHSEQPRICEAEYPMPALCERWLIQWDAPAMQDCNRL